VLGSLLNRRNNLSIRNRVLYYKQLIRLIVDYDFLTWRYAARSYVRKLQVLQSKCLCIAPDARWYISDRQLHEDLGVPFFAEHIRALTESYDLMIPGVVKPLVRQLGRFYADRGHAQVACR
jgi:hypothetical protein